MSARVESRAIAGGQLAAPDVAAPDVAAPLGSDAATRDRDVARPRVRSGRAAWLIPTLAFGLALAMAFAAARGSVMVPLSHIAGIVLAHVGISVRPFWTATEESIVWQLRLPRVVAAALVGGALATSGALLQGLFRNGLADPFVLGVSAGAAFAATVTVAILSVALGGTISWVRLMGFGPVPLAGAAGGLLAVAVVYNLARRGGRVPVTRLLLAGFAVSSMLSAGSTLLILLSDRLMLNWRSLFAWLVGGVAVSGWAQLGAATPMIVLGIAASWALARWLDALLLGEEGAAHLGVPVELARTAVIVVATLLTGAAVALAGLVGFVGLLVPHAIRLVLGPSHRTLIPAAALGGALMLVLADLLGRTLLAPTELPVGAMTALAGGPAFLWLLRRETHAGKGEG